MLNHPATIFAQGPSDTKSLTAAVNSKGGMTVAGSEQFDHEVHGTLALPSAPSKPQYREAETWDVLPNPRTDFAASDTRVVRRQEKRRRDGRRKNFAPKVGV